MAERREGAGGEWLYVVRVSVDPGVEDEWNRWYDDEHLPEILGCPGFVSGRRYTCRNESGRTSYMTVYSITDSTALETPEVAAAKGWHRFIDAVEFTTDVYRPTGEPSA